jgi:transcriptional regulator with XRE-family HTH domain
MKPNTILKAVRAHRGETLRDMAGLLGLKSVSAYSAKENGLREFKQGEMEILAAHFNMSEMELFFADEVRLMR